MTREIIGDKSGDSDAVNLCLTGPQRHCEDHQDETECWHDEKEHKTMWRADDCAYNNISAAAYNAPEIKVDRRTQSERHTVCNAQAPWRR